MYNNCRTHTTKTQLPEDIITILDSIHDNAKSMSASTYPVRRKKGELLKQFLFELKCHKGNMEEIHGFISSLTLNVKNIELIKTHHNPIFDFFLNKKTTRSEDELDALTDVIKAHITKTTLNQMAI